MWNSPDHVRLVSGVRENGLDLEVHSDIRRDSLTKNPLPTAPKSPETLDSFSSTGTVPPFLLTPLPLITDSKLHLLWPQPQEILQTEGPPFRNRGTPLSVVLDAEEDTTLHASLDIWDVHQETFASTGVECIVEDVVCPETTQGSTVFCHLSPGSHARFESYKLIVTDKWIRILSPDVIGLHYALCTLGQLFSLYNEDGEICVPALYIHDWPQLQHRAVLLDFSPAARKPDLETLKGYIKVMSLLKLRQLHCFYNLESGFPFSNRALLDLSRHCRQHLVDIIPVVDSDKEVKAEDVGQSLHCLVTIFSTKKVQVGPNLSKKILTSKEMMSCLPMLLSNCKIFLSFDPAAESVFMLPLSYAFVEDTSRVEQDFDSGAKGLMLAGFDVCVESQTGSQGSIAGRSSENAVPSMHRAAFSASCHRGSFGLLISDYQTLPQPAPFCFSWPGILLGLGLAWNTSVHQDYLHARLPELLNRHVYRDPEQVLGYLNVELGRLEDFLHGAVITNGSFRTPSVLHQMTVDPDMVSLDHFTLDLLQQVIRHTKKFEVELSKSKPICDQHAQCISEIRLAMDLLHFACRLGKALVSTGLNPSGDSCGLAVINVGVSNLPNIAKTDLANRLLSVRERFQAVWLSRNLPRGLETSLSVLDALLRRLVPEGTPLPSDVPPNGDD